MDLVLGRMVNTPWLYSDTLFKLYLSYTGLFKTAMKYTRTVSNLRLPPHLSKSWPFNNNFHIMLSLYGRFSKLEENTIQLCQQRQRQFLMRKVDHLDVRFSNRKQANDVSALIFFLFTACIRLTNIPTDLRCFLPLAQPLPVRISVNKVMFFR